MAFFSNFSNAIPVDNIKRKSENKRTTVIIIYENRDENLRVDVEDHLGGRRGQKTGE